MLYISIFNFLEPSYGGACDSTHFFLLEYIYRGGNILRGWQLQFGKMGG